MLKILGLYIVDCFLKELKVLEKKVNIKLLLIFNNNLPGALILIELNFFKFDISNINKLIHFR
jgi:hypothetical protein